MNLNYLKAKAKAKLKTMNFLENLFEIKKKLFLEEKLKFKKT